MSTTAKNTKTKTLGPGLLQYELIPDPDREDAEHFCYLIDFGSVGDVKINTKRTIISAKDGTPQQIVVADVSEEEVTIEIELSEQSAVERIARLGAGTSETSAADPSKSETEYKTLTGTAFEALLGRDATIVSVTSTDATPITYTETDDYIKGTKEGSTAIRRVSDGDIADGEQVIVTYTWDKPLGELLSFGGANTLNYYRLRHVKKTREDERIIHRFFRVIPGGVDNQEFLKTDYGKTVATFTAMADTSKDEGEQIFDVEYESA